MSETIHASTIAIGGHAVLIEGPSGAGKSDLALRLIDRGAVLVSDDYTVLSASQDILLASPPATIAGQMEVRGIGIVSMAHAAPVPVALLVRLADRVERLPEAESRCFEGVPVPAIALDPHEASAPIKVELALRHLLGHTA
ncbi:HPr kinase/phosphatase C-terminal domain-containing protein [Sphingomonas sp. ZT3P38]|uniref:HPr kinase/phosphorylase n=1 Tax=Parasphingomonas zepuensis TaxID=3096161 RepID=UPI002FCC312D